MWKVPDVRLLWVLGAALLFLGGFGVLAAGTIVALPIILGATALGFPLDLSLRLVAYCSPLWAPIGAGMGMVVTSNVVKGLRAKAPE
jgi:hypothetical protein